MRTKDQTIAIALRVASNFYCIGQHAQAYGVKRKCKLVSREALVGRDGDKRAWHDNTTNEHWYPIQSVWEYIVENIQTITPDDVIELLERYGIVVVTKEEDRRLRNIQTWGSPEECYAQARIEIMVEQGGQWMPYQSQCAI